MIAIGEHGRVSFGRKANIQWKQETCFHCNMDFSFVTRVFQAKWHGRDLHTKTIHTQLCSDGVCKTRVLHEIYIYPKFLMVGSPASWSYPSSTPLMSLSFWLWKTRHWKLLIFGSATHFQSSSIDDNHAWTTTNLVLCWSCNLMVILQLQIGTSFIGNIFLIFRKFQSGHVWQRQERCSGCYTMPSCSSRFFGSFYSDSYWRNRSLMDGYVPWKGYHHWDIKDCTEVCISKVLRTSSNHPEMKQGESTAN